MFSGDGEGGVLNVYMSNVQMSKWLCTIMFSGNGGEGGVLNVYMSNVQMSKWLCNIMFLSLLCQITCIKSHYASLFQPPPLYPFQSVLSPHSFHCFLFRSLGPQLLCIITVSPEPLSPKLVPFSVPFLFSFIKVQVFYCCFLLMCKTIITI